MSIISLLLYYIYLQNNNPVVERVSIKSRKVKKSFTILQLSDLHLRRYGRREKKALNLIKKVEFDLLILSGDYLNTPQAIGDLSLLLSSIGRSHPAFAVLGNHDYQYNLNVLEKTLNEAGIELLENRGQEINIKGQKLNIIGVGSPDLGKDDIEKATKGLELKGSYNIIISHTYDIVDRINTNMGIDLALAGDTHGGQVFLPFIGEKILKWLKGSRYIAGKYKVKDSILYINRGLGTVYLPFRFNCPPEITLIEVNPK